MSDGCPPRLMLELAIHGELDPDATRDHGAHLASCPSCAAALAQLRGEAERYRASPAAVQLRRLLIERAARRPTRSRSPWLRALWLAAPLAVAAGWLLVPRAGPTDFAWKGRGVLRLSVRRDGAQRAWDGRALQPGDVVQLAWSAPTAGHLAVFFRAASGEVTLLYPASGSASAPVAGGAVVSVGDALRADAAIAGGHLWWYFSEASFPVAPLVGDVQRDRAPPAGAFAGEAQKVELPR